MHVIIVSNTTTSLKRNLLRFFTRLLHSAIVYIFEHAIAFIIIKPQIGNREKRGEADLFNRCRRILTSRKTYFILISILVCVVFFELHTSGAFSSKKPNQSGIELLIYEWTDKIFETGSIRYEMITDNTVKVSFNSNGVDEREISNENSFDSSCLSKMNLILAEHSVHEWNGFNRHFWPLRILDYDSTFSLTIRYKDGGTMKASGYMNFPEGYNEFKNSLVNYTYKLFKE